MKKNVLFYVCALLLLMVGAVGCSSDDVDENIVQEAAATEEVKAFFDKDFTFNYSEEYAYKVAEDPDSYNSEQSWPIAGFFIWDEFLHNLVVVRTINSREEFEHTYNGKFQLPDIDFSKNTLIVGLARSNDSSETLGRVRLCEATEGNYELQVIIDKDVNREHVFTLAIKPLLFWKMYPKFPTNKMTVVRRIDEYD